MLRILHIEDEDAYARMVRDALRGHGGQNLHLHRVDRVRAGLDLLARERFHLVLLDMSLPDGEGVTLIDRIRAVAPEIAIVGLSGTIDEAEALNVVSHGAQDFVSKDEIPQRGALIRAIRYAIERQHAKLQLESRARALALDVAERDRQLLHSQRMEAIGRLAGGVAHDFNNLLTVIHGYSNFLAARLTSTEDQEDLREIRQAAERATVLTRQLLAFSRRQPMQLVVLDLNEVLEEMVRFLRPLIGEDVTVETRLGRDVPTVLADRGQIEQVIVNLAVNARDAMAGGGTLVLETAGAPADPLVLLAVRDTGTGIPPEIRARIFEPFFTTKEMGKGTGLGLSTVFGIVAQSGGTVEVESEVGRGTSFLVRLPAAARPSTGEGPPPVQAPARTGSETILVVEDDEVVRNLATRILRSAGYRIVAAVGPAEALEAARSRRESIDLVVSDVLMPKMNGRQGVEGIRASHPEARVLFISGYSGDAMSNQGLIDRNAPLLEKPFTRETLLAKVREVLDARP